MDRNKLLKLKEINYKVHKTCGSCNYSNGFWNDALYSTCNKFSYKHEKHTEFTRQLSIHRDGSCDEWEQSDLHKNLLGKFEEFLED